MSGLHLLALGLNADPCTENPDMLCVIFPDYLGKFQDITLNPIMIASIYVLPILFSLTVRLFDNTFNALSQNKEQKIDLKANYVLLK